GRRCFDFKKPGAKSCLDGDYNRGLVCDPTNGMAVPPATLAKFKLDVKVPITMAVLYVVNEYDLPVMINPALWLWSNSRQSLPRSGPASLKGLYDIDDIPVGYKSACEANLDANSSNCCTGCYDAPAPCPSSGVQDYYYNK
ncbi:hypothetical protein EDB19DRAFT_1595160, partial [Suillus lakei]